MQTEYILTPIGRVVSTRTKPTDDDWDNENSSIVLDEKSVSADATAGLDTFSHIEVIYVLNQVSDEKIVFGARRPRGNQDWPLVGILAQRAKNRPNKLGVTICQVESIDRYTVHVRGLDAIDGTPVLDIKPVMTAFLPRNIVIEPSWAKEIMLDYWKRRVDR